MYYCNHFRPNSIEILFSLLFRIILKFTLSPGSFFFFFFLSSLILFISILSIFIIISPIFKSDFADGPSKEICATYIPFSKFNFESKYGITSLSYANIPKYASSNLSCPC